MVMERADVDDRPAEESRIQMRGEIPATIEMHRKYTEIEQRQGQRDLVTVRCETFKDGLSAFKPPESLVPGLEIGRAHV